MVNWKKNLAVIWLSQFLSIMGFSFSMPFHAYYMEQELGVTDQRMLIIYVALFGAIAPLSIAIFGPIWGAVADRYGRRLMMLRAYTGAAFFLYLMGLTNSITMFLVVRFLQGVLTGTMTAAQALVAAHTPEKHSGFALGTLSSGVYAGAMAGVAAGGFCADQFGYKNAFIISSLILVIATLLVLFGTSEEFERPQKTETSSSAETKGFGLLKPILPVLIVLGVASFARRFDMAMFPLLVKDIHGSPTGSGTRLGLIIAPAAVAASLSGMVLGHLADRFGHTVVLVAAACMAAILMIPMGMAETMTMLFVMRFAVSFCVGGYEPILQSWTSNLTPGADRGRLFGWISTMRGIGWMMAPLVSGLVAYTAQVRTVFFAGSAVFIVLAAAIYPITRKPGRQLGQ